MSESNLLSILGQVSSESAGEIFRNYLRGAVLGMISDVMASEVSALCGEKYHPADTAHFRAGSTPAKVIYEGDSEVVTRPRVRKRRDDGTSGEVSLDSFQAACDPTQLQQSIVQALVAGVSSRDIKTVAGENAPGTSKSNVSRLWQSAGDKFVEQLRSVDLSQQDWAILMLDGIRLSKDQTAIAAIGITSEGVKYVLDFDLGSSENSEVCRNLLRRLVQRGFHCDRRLFAVLDGSQALSNTLREFFDDVVIQRCLVHKERNIRAKLSKRHWGELARLFKRLRTVQGRQAAEEVTKELEGFLEPINAEALKSLREAGDELLALHSLEVPNTLHRSLLNTNAIENSFRNTRRKMGRVTRFRAETDQATRWLAYALSEVQKGFRKIAGHNDMPKLLRALQRE